MIKVTKEHLILLQNLCYCPEQRCIDYRRPFGESSLSYVGELLEWEKLDEDRDEYSDEQYSKMNTLTEETLKIVLILLTNLSITEGTYDYNYKTHKYERIEDD